MWLGHEMACQRPEFLVERSLSHGVFFGREQGKAGLAIERTGFVLLDGVGQKVLRQVATTGSHRDDIATQGRKVAAPGEKGRGGRLSPTDLSLRGSDLTAKFGAKPANHRANPVSVAPHCRGVDQFAPGVVERPIVRLHGHEKLGIDRDRGIILMELHQGSGGDGPDPRRRARMKPAGFTPPVRPFDPFRQCLDGFLGREHGHLGCESVVTLHQVVLSRRANGTEIANRIRQ
jgi:hypothetical protein